MARKPRTTKIAYLAGQYPAISHTFILREVLALQKAGLDVRTCSVRRTGPEHLRGPEERAAAAQTFYIQNAARRIWPLFRAQGTAFVSPMRYMNALGLAWRTRAAGAKSLLYQLFYFAEATILADYLRRHAITHLHSHFAQSGSSVAMMAAHLADVPFSFTLHGPADLDAPKDWHLGTKVARSHFVACISNFARSQAMRYTEPTHWHKLKIIHCGVVPNRYDLTAYTLQHGTELIFVGRLAPVKGLRILLDAMATVLPEKPDLTLTIIGDGPDRTALEELARPLGNAVQFTGYQSQAEVAERLAAADILILPSFAEGVPVVLMEAMASAKPVICTQVAGVSELVEDGVSGWIVPPGDVTALRVRILELASDPDRRAAMGRAGRARVLEEFNANTEARRLVALFVGGNQALVRPSPLSDSPIG